MTFPTLSHSHLHTLAIAVLAGACAQASTPPGGEKDVYPPLIVSTVPEQGAIVPNFKGEVRFKFDETLSERGVRKSEMILVSPEPGEVEVDRSGSEVKVKLKGGWQPGRVYHVTVLPGVQDRRGNVRTAAYELVFSTGPEIPSTVLGGVVTDRLTGRPVANARVFAVGTTDSAIYATLTDTAGFYALRSLPVGMYLATATIDLNRNRTVDFPEPRDSALVNIGNVADTMVHEFSVLAPDTTPARLLKAEARDSQQVRLTFDDFIPPGADLSSVSVRLWQLPDSTSVMTGFTVSHVRDFEARMAAARDTGAQAARPPIAARPGATQDTARGPLPAQELVLAPLTPLAPRTRYRVSVFGIRNIAGVVNGGGSVTFETPAPPRPPVVRPDTTAAPEPADTIAPRLR